MINLSSFIVFHARRSRDRCALKYGGTDIPYAEFDRRIGKVAGWLVSRGIGPNDVVAVLMKNSIAFLELLFATSGPCDMPSAPGDVGFRAERAQHHGLWRR